MQILNGLTVLLLFQLVGELGVRWLGLPVPGPVLGMLLLFIALVLRQPLADQLEPASTGLLTHLSLLFVPAGVGVMVHLDRIGDEWLALSVALLVSTVVTLTICALLMAGLIKLRGKESGHGR